MPKALSIELISGSLKEGIPVTDAAERLDRSLGLETVFCDALEFDSFWLERLFEAAGIELSFQLSGVHQLFGTLGAERALLLEEIIRKTPAPHRAREDAQRYVAAYCAVTANHHL
ncbi:hypothetical protein FEI13_17580 [Halomonas urmiana]|uniref:Uncharacterized protein n=1 Tax=Halomonas urmiana TaxID=490901 RepID=A0A5R8M8U4_9GAMM|nr:hypothetical protein [Halomonas urmiana]TLF45927.1 hypothetical protein FEI13_17580 [Halomonas urmiana]